MLWKAGWGAAPASPAGGGSRRPRLPPCDQAFNTNPDPSGDEHTKANTLKKKKINCLPVWHANYALCFPSSWSLIQASDGWCFWLGKDSESIWCGRAGIIYCYHWNAAQNTELIFLRAFLLGLSSLCLPALWRVMSIFCSLSRIWYGATHSVQKG